MYRSNNDGFVSLLTAVMLSLLLLAITVSLIGLQTLTLRKAEDSEQSQRAYFGAESGVEDAIARINTKSVLEPSGQTCALPSVSQNETLGATPGALGWSCQSITFSGSPSDVLRQPDVSTTIDPSASAFTSIQLLWDQSAPTVAAANYYNPPLALTGGAANWGNRAMPLELTVIAYPRSPAPFTAKQIVTQTALVLPRLGGAGIINYTARNTYDATSSALLQAAQCNAAHPVNCGIDANNPYSANCGGAIVDISGNTGTYHCSITLQALNPAFSYVFRLKSRYISENGSGNGRFVMNFYSGLAKVAVADSTATIDVTGKAGDVYRRVIYKLPKNLANGGLDYALYSEVGLCQNYTILNGTKQPVGACP
jgi:Tfp pilus assembly protein PilV